MLIQCPDCSQEVSDSAPACPKCGRPIAAPPAREVKARSSVMDGVNIGCGIFIVLPLILILGFIFISAIAQQF